VDVNITLSEQEQKIFKTLMEVIEEHQLKTTLRVAGGWVRDKVSIYISMACMLPRIYWE
jgi:hypothetical protein